MNSSSNPCLNLGTYLWRTSPAGVINERKSTDFILGFSTAVILMAIKGVEAKETKRSQLRWFNGTDLCTGDWLSLNRLQRWMGGVHVKNLKIGQEVKRALGQNFSFVRFFIGWDCV